jgi:hypothetical protein
MTSAVTKMTAAKSTIPVTNALSPLDRRAGLQVGRSVWFYRDGAITMILCVDARSIFQFRIGVSLSHAEAVAIPARLISEHNRFSLTRGLLPMSLRGAERRSNLPDHGGCFAALAMT